MSESCQTSWLAAVRYGIRPSFSNFPHSNLKPELLGQTSSQSSASRNERPGIQSPSPLKKKRNAYGQKQQLP